ncbi:MAG: RNase adapter RapZ [Erysipelotrichia bacterium]|nr:RNase adapter RapZ [Erysipelotrichia bacterium]
MELLIISGLSGAGKSSTYKILEDIGYYCIDNLPPALLVAASKLNIKQKLAIIIDSRSKDKYEDLLKETIKLKQSNTEYRLLFLYCDKEEILNRYKYTRRTHPLVSDSNPSLEAAIEAEFKLCKDVLNAADIIIDTTHLTYAKLRKMIIDNFADKDYKGLTIKIISFGYKNGLPNEADLIFDVRCLPNPFYVEELRNHTGLEKCVEDYVFAFEQTNMFLEKILDFIRYSLPFYFDEGKNELVIAIGCTSGHHRSVAFAQRLAVSLTDLEHKVIVLHRDIEKDF